MNRRGFLTSLLGIAATATLDPERLLWVPGKKLTSIPKPRVVSLDYDWAVVQQTWTKLMDGRILYREYFRQPGKRRLIDERIVMRSPFYIAAARPTANG